MKISNSSQMFQILDQGGSLRLNSHNQVAKQSSFRQVLQRIGDSMLSISATGRSHIARRTSALHEAMAHLVAQDPPINPAAGSLSSNMSPAQKVYVAARLQAALAVHNSSLPQSMHRPARRFIEATLRGMVNNGSLKPQDIVSGAKKLLRNISNDATLMYALDCDYTSGGENYRELNEILTHDIKQHFYDPRQQNQFDKVNGMSPQLLLDALRGSMTIGGEFPMDINNMPDDGDLRNSIIEQNLMKYMQGLDRRFVSLITMICSQTGMEGALIDAVTTGKGSPAQPNSANPVQAERGSEARQTMALLAPYGMMPYLEHRINNLEIHDGKATITTTADINTQVFSVENRALDAAFPIGGGRYEIKVEIDLTQDLGNNACPAFSITDIHRSPLEMES